jgi:hypothetical protein
MLTFLLYLAGFTLSATAAYYSVTGLAYIFAGAFLPVLVMGIALEAAKLVGASWTFRYWRTAPRALTLYISTGVLALMVLTGLGIFGFLSRAYLSQQAPAVAMSVDLAAADRAVALAQEQYDRDVAAMRSAQDNRSATSVIDRLASNGRLTGTSGAVSVLRQQQTLQRTLQTSLNTSATALKDAETARATLQRLFAEQTVDVGPLMFVAKAWYGTADIPTMDRAVRWLILLIMSAFDPMAIALLLAAQQTPPQRTDTPDMTPRVRPSSEERVQPTVAPVTDTPQPRAHDPLDVPTAAEFSSTHIEPVTDIVIEHVEEPPDAVPSIDATIPPAAADARSRWKIGRRRTRVAPKT